MKAPSDEFDAFVRSRTGPLLRSAYLLTGDQHLAEDLVQAALVRTHRYWSRLHATGNAEAYTRTVMYHIQVSWWRRRRFREAYPGDLPEPAPSGRDLGTDAALRLAVRTALAQLGPRQRAVVVLRYFEDRTEPEVAEILGISVGTVKSATFKALRRLRQVAPHLNPAAALGAGFDSLPTAGGNR
jgi:RNA polymerase sigma-70 factor (sigma-E family)